MRTVYGRYLLHGEPHTQMLALINLSIILDKTGGPTLTLRKPDVQALDIHQVPLPAKGASCY